MRRGQIGTDAEGRVFFVWEGLVAVLPDHRLVRGLERLATTTGQFRRAVDYWKVQDRALALMWSLNQRTLAHRPRGHHPRSRLHQGPVGEGHPGELAGAL